MHRPLRLIPALLSALALALAGCGGGGGDTDTQPTDGAGQETEDAGATEEGVDTSELNLITEGTLTVCTDAPYEPFEYEDPEAPSGYAGFDIDLLQEIGDRLGLELAVKNTGFDAIKSGVAMASDQCDLAAAAMTITDERAENVLFSDPYFDADQSLLAKRDSGIASLDDLAGKTIAVQSATTGEAYATENAPEDATVKSFENPADLFTALEADQVAAVLQDFPVNSEKARQDDSVAVVETYTTGESYGFAARKDGKDALIKEVDRALGEMREDGTYDEIFATYFEAPEES